LELHAACAAAVCAAAAAACTESSHKWNSNATDWGFTQFMLLGELLDPERGFVVNDTVKIKVEITVEVRTSRLVEVGTAL
jgi:ubiquitin carboxyl-terminal hydrolase 7